MSVKDDAQPWIVNEQIIEDLASGLTFQFEVIPEDRDAPFHLKIFGDLPYGNREIQFDKNGNKAGAGTLLSGLCKPTWSVPID